MNWKDFKQIIYLLEDEDPEVYAAIMEKLVDEGEAFNILYEKAERELDLTELVEERLDWVARKIQYHQLSIAFEKWASVESDNLLKGLILVASYAYQTKIDERKLLQRLETIAEDIEMEMSITQSASKNINYFNRVFFKIHHFSIIAQQEVSPQYFCINLVLAQRKGEALLISLVYLVIAQMLKLPVEGVILPDYLILSYLKPHFKKGQQHNSQSVQFYINPVKKGVMFSAKEIREYLEEEGVPIRRSYFYPSNNRLLLIHLIEALQVVYRQSREEDRSDELEVIKASIMEYL